MRYSRARLQSVRWTWYTCGKIKDRTRVTSHRYWLHASLDLPTCYNMSSANYIAILLIMYASNYTQLCSLEIHVLNTSNHDETCHSNASYYLKTTNYEQGRARVTYHPKPNKQESVTSRDVRDAQRRRPDLK